MAAQEIRMFTHSYLAFYRPRKRSYFCLKYVPNANVWEPFSIAMVAEGIHATIRKSTVHNIHNTQPGAHIFARTSPRADRQRERIQIMGTGLYLSIPLQDGTAIIAAIVTRPIAMPGKYIDTEIEAVHGVPYEMNTRLWQDPAPPEPPAAPVPAVQATKLTAIPRRIAWLVAEDAQKQGETCPISLEAISPLTASVTTCFHCFDSEQLNAWLATRPARECPMCKKACLATKAFEEEGVNNPL